jgi:hypothetical protein
LESTSQPYPDEEKRNQKNCLAPAYPMWKECSDVFSTDDYDFHKKLSRWCR